MSYCERYLIGVCISFAYAQLAILQELRDPSPQEVALVDWASGIQFAICGDAAFENVTSSFKSVFADVLNKFCENFTACHLQKSVAFNPGDIMVLEGYPRREYNGVRIRFVVILPKNALLPNEQTYPLLSKEVIFKVFGQSQYDIENRMQMYIIEYERYPRFDSITEFMNTAVIPIGFLLMVIMFGLAYWTSTLTSNRNGGGSWGKEKSEKRDSTPSSNDERNLEEGLQQIQVVEKGKKSKKHRFNFRKNRKCSLKSESEADIAPVPLIRQNAMSVISQPFSAEALDGSTNDLDEAEFPKNPCGLCSTNRQRAIGFTRRLSSFEEAFKERKRRKTRRNGGGNKRDMNNRWKSTSMALGGFRPTK